MPWRKILFWSTLAVTGLLVLALGWLWAGDLGVIKPHVERWVTEKTGREFVIDELSIDLGPRVIVIAKGLRFADADWTGRKYMASADEAVVMFDLRTLFDPPFIIEAMDLTNASVVLTKRVDGTPNWALDITPAQEDPEETPPEPEEVPVLIRNTMIQNISIDYEDPDREGTIGLVVSSLNQAVDEDQILIVVSRGSLSGQNYEIEARAGTWSSLLSGEDVSFTVDSRFDTISISGEGTIDDLFNPLEPTFGFEIVGPDIDDLTRMLGLGDRSDGSIRVSGKLEARDQSPMLLTVHGDVGAATVDATIEFGNLADFSTIDADVSASGPNLGAILALGGISGVREAPYLVVADIERAGERVSVRKAEMVFGDTRFNLTANLPKFPSVDEGNLALDVRGPDIARLRYLTGLPGAASGAFSVNVNLAMDAEQRELFDLAMETSLGKLTARGEIKGGNTYLGSYADLELELFNIRALSDAWNVNIGDLPADALSATATVEYVDGGIRTRRPVSASLADLKLSVEGLVALEKDLIGTTLLFEASGDQLRYVTNPFTEPKFVPPLPFTVQGQLLVKQGEFHFTDVEGLLGTTDVAGDVSIRPGKRIAGSTIEFSAKGERAEELTSHIPRLRARTGWFGISGKLGFGTDSIEFEEVRIDREASTLTTNLSLGMPLSREFLRFDVRGQSANIRKVLAAAGSFEPAEVPWSLALAGERNGSQLRIDDLLFGLADSTLAATGNLEIGERLEHTDFSLDLDIPDMSRLGTFDGRNFNPQAFSFSASVEGADGEIRIDEIVTTLGSSNVNGAVIYRSGDTPYLDIDVHSDGLYYDPLLEPGEAEEYEKEPVRKDGRLIPDIPMPFDALASLDGDFDLDIAEFQRGGLYMYDVRVDANLADGILDIDDATFRTRAGYLRARALLDPADGEGRAKVEMITEGLAAGMAAGNQGLQLRIDSRVNLDATGNDLRTLFSNANGIVFLRTTGGEVGKLRVLNMLYGDMLDQIFSTINPFIKSESVTRLDCMVFPIQVVDGVTASDPASFVRTDKINITIKSEVNLTTEKLDISVRSTPRKILTISAAELVNPYIKIVGTLAKPTLAVDEQGVLITGGVAVATGGLSLVAKAAWDRLARSGDPCKTMFNEGVKALSPQFPDIPVLEEMPDRPAELAVKD